LKELVGFPLVSVQLPPAVRTLPTARPALVVFDRECREVTGEHYHRRVPRVRRALA